MDSSSNLQFQGHTRRGLRTPPTKKSPKKKLSEGRTLPSEKVFLLPVSAAKYSRPITGAGQKGSRCNAAAPSWNRGEAIGILGEGRSGFFQEGAGKRWGGGGGRFVVVAAEGSCGEKCNTTASVVVAAEGAVRCLRAAGGCGLGGGSRGEAWRCG